MLNKISYTIILMSVSLCGMSQFEMPKEKDAKEFFQRTLLVELREGEKAAANDIMKASVEEHFKPQDIKYLNKNEIKSLLSSDDKTKYSIFKVEVDSEIRPTPKTRVVEEGYQFKVFLAEKNKSLFTFMVPVDLGSDMQYDLICKTTHKYLKAAADGKGIKDPSLWDFDRNTDILSRKTLVLPKESLITTEEEAKKQYPYGLNFLSKAEFDETVLSNEENILVPSVVFHMKKKLWMFVIVDPSTLDILSLVPVESGFNVEIGRVVNQNSGFGTYYTLIDFMPEIGFKKQHFKAFAHKMAFKLNY